MIVIEDEALRQAGVSAETIRLEIAVLLYDKEVYSARKAAECAGVPWFEFQKILVEKGFDTLCITPEQLEQQVKHFEQSRPKQ